MSEHFDLSYPIGKYIVPETITSGHLHAWIDIIHQFPNKLEKAVKNLSDNQLDTPYRPGGWTIRQLVHHIADSHMNAYIRLKLGMTETEPTIKPYDQDSWAVMPDCELPVEVSLSLIKALHQRWYCSLEFIRDWSRTVYHPEQESTLRLDELTGMYAWHSEHHLAHILNLIKREEW